MEAKSAKAKGRKLQQWVREDPEIARNPKLIFKKLNDPEFRYFKTTPVRL